MPWRRIGVEVSGQFHIPAALAPDAHWIGGWVGPRAGLETVVKRKIPSPYRNPSGARSPAIYHWAIPAPSVTIDKMYNPTVTAEISIIATDWWEDDRTYRQGIANLGSRVLHSSVETCCKEYEDVSKSFRTGRLELELQMLQLSATRCSCIATLWVSVVSFAAITLCVASQRVFVVVYFIIDSVRKILDAPSYRIKHRK
jgi:hypothetical protein